MELRFIGTSDREKFQRWVDILKDKNIRYRATFKRQSIELIGYGKGDLVMIKEMLGINFAS